MYIACRKCRRVIEPNENFISICCGEPGKHEPYQTCWHVRCAPLLVRQYVPREKGGIAELR